MRRNGHYQQTARLVMFSFVLMIIFAGRVQFLTHSPLHLDEARSGMRMMGTLSEIIAWQPPDWPPLHNILIGAWSSLVGSYPFSLRVFSAFFSLISVCLAYRMAYQLTKDQRIAWGTMILYGGLGMSVYLGIFIRGYVLTMTLFPLAIGLTARYFGDHRRWDVLWLALTLGFMFISTYTSIVAFLFLGLYTVLVYPRQLWRWIPVGILASPFALIELLRKWDYWFKRIGSSNLEGGYGYDLIPTFLKHYQDYFGQLEQFWIVVAIVSLVLLFWKGHQYLRLSVWVLVGSILAPVITFWLVESRIFMLMTTRYSWWVLILLAFGLSLGLRYLPKVVWISGMVIILGLMFRSPLETRHDDVSSTSYYYEENMEWLSNQIESGDVLIFDPNYCIQECAEQDALAYYWEVYLGDRVSRINELGEYRRIWLWRGVGHSRELLEELSETHIASIFYGPPVALLELYEAPPYPEGILYENGIRFHGFDVLDKNGNGDNPPYNLREQTEMRIRLWWSTDRPLEEDYQVSIQVYDATKNQIFVQDDQSPKLSHLRANAFEPLPQQTSEWIPHQLYVEDRIIEIPNINQEIYAELSLVIYHLPDGQRIHAPNETTDGLLPLAEIIIWGWG